MYKNILCAIDTSEESKVILAKANSLAEKYQARLSIVHVIEYSLLPKDYQRKLKEDVIPKINKLADQYNIAKKYRYVKFGQAYTNICDLGEKHNADLIVVGSHGKYGIRALLGSTANGVLHHAKCDTILVKLG